jgi:hypothetical protein
LHKQSNHHQAQPCHFSRAGTGNVVGSCHGYIGMCCAGAAAGLQQMWVGPNVERATGNSQLHCFTADMLRHWVPQCTAFHTGQAKLVAMRVSLLLNHTTLHVLGN